MTFADFEHYPNETPDWLLNQLSVVASELYNAYIVCASTQAQEKHARVAAFLSSVETSVAGRERDAEAQSMHLTTALFEIQGRIRALTEERELLRVLLDYAGERH